LANNIEKSPSIFVKVRQDKNAVLSGKNAAAERDSNVKINLCEP
jgi:hypothetical protein